jgi:hypothetical protein
VEPKKELEGLPSCFRAREVGKRIIGLKELEQVVVVNVVRKGN